MKTLSYQLYSSRKFPPLSTTLKMLADIGYQQVEGFGGLFDDPAAVRAQLDVNGLTMPSGHFSLDSLENDLSGALAIARTLGVETIYCPFLQPDERPTDVAGYTALGERLASLGEKINDGGVKFGWHNHEFELEPLPDGSIPMAVLLDTAPNMEWEADIAWVAKGGADPLAWLARYADRVSAIHIKDIAQPGECADEDGWADVGYGTMDWPALFAAALGTAVRYFVMEHDNPNDDKRFASRSFSTVQSF